MNEADLKTELPAMDVASRLPKLREKFGELEIDAFLVTNLTNIRYLTGFTGSAAILLVTPNDSLFATDGRYKFQCVEQLKAAGVDSEILVGGGQEQKDALVAKASDVAHLGLEADEVTWAQQKRFAEKWFEGNELNATEGVVEAIRKVKDAGEIERIRRASHIADFALEQTQHRLADGLTEQEFAFELDTEIKRLTFEGNSFPTIVASGPNGANAHHQLSQRKIEHGELVVIDFGSYVDGYASDMTRTLAVGELRDPMMQKMYDVVQDSQQAGVDAVKAGATGGEVDDICRKIIAEAGWEDAFMHSTGHGVGLDVHEAPYVAAKQTEELVAGHVVTVEPGVYLEEWGGVRIEDTVAVTDDGCDVLTTAPKTLTV